MNAEQINALITSLDETRRANLQHVFVHLVQVIANPALHGFFMHTMPSPEDSEMESILVHGINCDGMDIEELMCNFLAARNAQAAADESNPERKH